VDSFYPQEHGYDPTLVIYNDSTGPTWVDQGNAVITAAKDNGATGGFAVVMLHEPGQRRPRKEDELAAFVLRKLYDDFDIRAAVMHTDAGTRAYQLMRQPEGSSVYQVRAEKRGKLDGYLRNVTLNKVLLTNEKWPFVLADPLYADLTIGVDLKARHVGFTLIGKGGAHIDTRIHKTRFPEQLRTDEFEKHLFEIVRRYHEITGEYSVQAVIHRDGRMFESELKGAKRAIQRLKDDGFIAPHASLSAIEIGKHSAASLRLFALHQRTATEIQAQNPTIGDYFILNDAEGYIASTGYPFLRDGTALPLHVRKVEGPLPMSHLLEDLFRLTTLTWSQPEGCSRYPISIKLNDRRLFEDAGQYDENEVELHEQEAEL
jgi:argonaute-like protein implicated in RNA metabolism and viral defense